MLGAIIGAGFISGAELVGFFGTENFVVLAIVSTVLTAITLSFIFFVFKKNENNPQTVENLFGEKKFYEFSTCFASYVFTASMLAGLDSLWNSLGVLYGAPVFSVLAMLLISVFSRYDIKGLEKLNLVLMPIVLIVVNFLIFTNLSLNFETNYTVSIGQTMNVFLYVFMNAFISLPVMRASAKGKNRKCLFIASIIVSLIIGVEMLLILSAVKGANVNNADMPLFVAINKKGFSYLFFISLFIGTFTSAFSAYYTAYVSSKSKGGSFGTVLSAIFTLILSRLGLHHIVKYLYPIIGGLGALFVIKSLVGIKKQSYADNKRNHKNFGGKHVKKEKE